jgi:hypothetical protein
VRYFHGGVRGLRAGDELVPPTEHNGPTLKQYANRLLGARTNNPAALAQLAEGSCVYLAAGESIARAFAALYPPPGGALYEVEPLGEASTDWDAPGESFVAPRARVVAVIDPEVAFDPSAIAELAR